MLNHRLVVLMDPQEHAALKALAEEQGTSVASVVREAIQERLARQRRSAAQLQEAAAFLCAEHDPGFEWRPAKRDLERRYDG